jgi:hypothetical protein
MKIYPTRLQRIVESYVDSDFTVGVALGSIIQDLSSFYIYPKGPISSSISAGKYVDI